MKQIHYFYKITNLINKKFYYGIRSCYFLPGKDPYMGSGTHLHNSFRKYGIENFSKEILRVCRTREDLSDLERWIVTDELVRNPNCYNQKVGGDDSDSFYGKVSCKDTYTGMNIMISSEEYYSNPDRYVSRKESIGKITVYDNIEKRYVQVSIDEYNINKDRYFNNFQLGVKGKVFIKDLLEDRYKWVDKNDPRILSGRFVLSGKLVRLTEESRKIISEKSSKRQSGKNNIMYNKTIINNGVINKSIDINEVDEFLDNNKDWKLGKLRVNNKNSILRMGVRIKFTDVSLVYKFDNLNKLSEILDNCQKVKLYNFTNGSENIKIDESQIPHYESLGYWRGLTQFNGHKNHNPNSGCKGFRYMNNGIEYKYVNPKDIPIYQSHGWKFGRLRSK